MFQVRGGDIETEKRLRKDLKRTKALLADAQIMLDHIKNNAPSKREIAQLKNQVPKSLVCEVCEVCGRETPSGANFADHLHAHQPIQPTTLQGSM